MQKFYLNILLCNKHACIDYFTRDTHSRVLITLPQNYLFVGSGVSVSKLVIPRCLRIPKLSKSCCYETYDPYCGWCGGLGKCTSKADCR